MKKFVLIAILLCCAGCGESQQRIASLQAVIETTQQKLVEVEKGVEAATTVAEEAKAYLSDPNLDIADKEKVVAMLDKAVAEKVRLMAIEAKIKEVLATMEAQLAQAAEAGGSIGDELTAYGGTATAVSATLPPPFNAIAYVGGLIASAVGANILQKRKSTAILTDVVRSVDKGLEANSDAIAASNIRVAMGDHQLPTTRVAVRAVRG